jgi:hypothetical protein
MQIWTCTACGTQDINILYSVLKTYPNGEQKEIQVCKSCRPEFDPVEVLFTRISGPSYTKEQRPSFWSNGRSLHLDWEQAFKSPDLPLSDYPLIEDFEVMLEGVTSKHKLGKEEPSYFVWLFSPSRGYLTYILGADELEELRDLDFVLPHGTFNHPYYDVDQGWEMVLAEDGDFVYILAGGWRELESYGVYTTWFKVEKKRYYHQWEQAIRLARSLLVVQEE